MDISNFMSWWINQVGRIFTYTFNTLNSIEFAGTSLLKITISITILSALIPVILTIANSKSITNTTRERRKRREENDN